MNLIYLHTHDTGRYLSPYGAPTDTPNLQSFAERATLFRNHYCCGPTCSPSRSAMLTGMHAHHNGMMGLAHRGFAIYDYEKHLAQYLGRCGYETMLCGMQHEAADARTLGYERLYIHDKASVQNATEWDMRNGDAAIAFLREAHERPFFLSYGLEHTHRPFEELDADIDPRYQSTPGPLPDAAPIREDYAGFLTSARRADACLGRIFDVITEMGLWENTVVMYTTDHGIAFPWMKCNLYDAGIGTALMLHDPNHPGKGAVVDALTSHLDIYPTLCDLLGLPTPEWTEGVSLLPLLREKTSSVRNEIYAQVLYHAAYDPQIAVRTDRYKYIRRFDTGYQHPVLPNIDNSLSKEYLLSQGLAEIQIPREALYDLSMDPGERNNLTGAAAHQDTLAAMRGKLDAFMREGDHPLLHGPLPLPPGAFALRPDVLDPEDTGNPENLIWG